MPGALGYGWHEGNRGEYLAQYFLSALGVSAPVIRQSDIGIDFYCALAKESRKKLTFHSPFSVQHGAASKRLTYNGDGLRWLFSQELPFFISTTDRSKNLFRLYSTSAMWPIRYVCGNEIAEITLVPDDASDPRIELQRKGKDPQKSKLYYRIPIGNPVVELRGISPSRTDVRNAIEALRIAVALEQQNIVWRNLGLHSVCWFKNPRPNDPFSLEETDFLVAWNTKKGRNVRKQIEALKAVAVALALNLSAQKTIFQLDCLAPVFGLFLETEIPPSLLAKLPEVVRKYLRK
jgi:hypothetical protein